jgi:hypothetical protein
MGRGSLLPALSHHTAFVEKSPAWRLLLVGELLRTKKIGTLPSECEYDDRELRDWQREVVDMLGWAYFEGRSGSALRHRISAGGRQRRVTETNLFDCMTGTALVRRDRDRLLYLRGKFTEREGEWCDFVSIGTNDGYHVFRGKHCAARDRFLRRERFRHFGIGAVVFGRHWDMWWRWQGGIDASKRSARIVGESLATISSWYGDEELHFDNVERFGFFRFHDIAIRKEFLVGPSEQAEA